MQVSLKSAEPDASKRAGGSWLDLGPRPPLQGGLPKDIVYGVDDSPPIALLLLAGVQWVGGDTSRTQPDADMLRRGVVADGLGTMFAGLSGTMGINAMTAAAAIPAATGLASRRIAYVVTAMLGVLAMVPAVGLLLAGIPRGVIGGLALYTGTFVLASGLQAITSVPLDNRRTIVIGLGLFGGLSSEAMPQLASGWLSPITGSSLVLGTLVAMLANLLLPRAGSGPAQ